MSSSDSAEFDLLLERLVTACVTIGRSQAMEVWEKLIKRLLFHLDSIPPEKLAELSRILPHLAFQELEKMPPLPHPPSSSDKN